jgi:titin
MSGKRKVLLDDFNLDGYLDIAFNVKFSNAVVTSKIPFYLGSSSGIDDTVDYQLDFENYPYYWDVGDINGDGQPDLVVSTQGGTSSNNQLHIFKGTSAFWNPNTIHPFDITTQASRLEVVDVDRDGYDDIITTDSQNMKVYFGRSLWPSTYSISKTGVTSPMDMAVAVPKGALKGMAGSFLTEYIPIPGGKTWDILHVDADLPMDTDMKITVFDSSQQPIPGLEDVPGPSVDLTVIENWRSISVKVTIWSRSNQTTPTLRGLTVNWMDWFTWRDQFYGTLRQESSLGLGIIDEQLKGSADPRGTSDLVFPCMRNDVDLTTGSLGFVDAGDLDYASIAPVRLATVGATAVDASDVDGDGIEDLVFASYGKALGNLDGNSPMFLGSQTGWYGIPHHIFYTSGAMDVVMTDLNGDGHADVVFAQEQSDSGYNVKSTLFWGSEEGWNASADVRFSTTGASGLEVVDVNDDGLPDLVFACYRDADFTADSLVFLQDSAGYCGTEPDRYLETVGARAVASGDIDKDGYVDLVFACHEDGDTFAVNSLIYKGGAGGNFGAIPTEIATVGAMDVEVADLNGDGHLDIAFANNRNSTSGYLGESYVYLADGSGGFGSSPSVRLPTDGASAVEVADLDGEGDLDLVFACSNNATTFDIPSVVYLGGADGWSTSPDILLPTVGAMDPMAMLLSDPDRGGYVSEAITPDERDDIGSFDTLRYEATLDASHSATLEIIDAETGETLFETQVKPGLQELDLRGRFFYKLHPSIRIRITADGLDGGGGFSLDDLWVNWTKRVPRPPEVLDASLTNTTCLRTDSVQVWVDAVDEYDTPDSLKVTVEHKHVDETIWGTYLLGDVEYVDDHWEVDVMPDRYATLGVYLFRVTVEDDDRMSSGEHVLEQTLEVLPNLPRAPVMLEATAGDSQVQLSWRAPAISGDLPIEGYWLHRGTSEDGLERIVTLDAIATSYTDEGLVNGETYYYAIHVFNDLGESPLSNVLNATPAGLPGVPVNLAAESGDASATLVWEPPLLDGGLPVLSYYIWRSTGEGELEWLTVVEGQVYEDVMLSNGATYGYSVSALNALGEGPLTEPVTVVPLGIPDPPGDLSVAAGLKSLSLSWVPPLRTGGGDVTGYRIYRGDDPDDLRLLEEVGGQVNSYTDTDVTVGSTYHYAVMALTDGGESVIGTAVAGGPIDYPESPMDLVTEAGDGQVVLTWDSLTELETLDAVTTFTDLQVTNGQTYWYAVVAVNVLGESEQTDAVEATPLTPPTVPNKVPTLTVDVRDGEVVLVWAKPGDDGGTALTGYVVLRGASRDDLQVIAQVGGFLSYTDHEVEPGTTYYYSVAALNVVGRGEGHEALQATVPEVEEESMSMLPIALAVIAVVVIILIALLVTRRRAAPAETEEVDEVEEEDDEQEDEEEGDEGEEPSEDEEGTEEEEERYSDIVIEHIEVR